MAMFCGDVDASWLSVYMVGSLVRLPISIGPVREGANQGNRADVALFGC